MEEKRQVKQIKKYDEEGNLECVVIPNYRKCDYFMSANEIRFYKFLVKVIATIRENDNLNLEVYPQVALNRIIMQNNRREKELEKDLFGKSIDYVIYDKNTDQIVCCIELDGPEHQTAERRIERDKMIDLYEDDKYHGYKKSKYRKRDNSKWKRRGKGTTENYVERGHREIGHNMYNTSPSCRLVAYMFISTWS